MYNKTSNLNDSKKANDVGKCDKKNRLHPFFGFVVTGKIAIFIRKLSDSNDLLILYLF